jgi:hypothetical protein
MLSVTTASFVFFLSLFRTLKIMSCSCCSCRWGETVIKMRPPAGLFYIPQMTNEYGATVKWYRGEPKNLEKSMSQCHTVHHSSNMDWPGPLVKGQRLSTWSMAQWKIRSVFYLINNVKKRDEHQWSLVFWDLAPCSHVEVDRSFRGSYCLHHQGSE